jgi:hypothetical protein
VQVGAALSQVSRTQREHGAAYSDYLDLVPKVELHLHIAGAVHASTLIDIATANGVRMPRPAEMRRRCSRTCTATGTSAMPKSLRLWRVRRPENFARGLRMLGHQFQHSDGRQTLRSMQEIRSEETPNVRSARSSPSIKPSTNWACNSVD